MRVLPLLGALLGLAACAPGGQGVRYVVGGPYQAGGIWRYPAETFSLDETGVATTLPARFGTTANGEPADGGALTAAHRTLQLPAIARITNLENGRQVVVRINDRGPADPARLIAVSRRTAQLLAAADPAGFRVRLELLEPESRQLAARLQGQGGSDGPPPPRLAAAPRDGVQSEQLAPPSGTAAGQGRSAPAPLRVAAAVEAPVADFPLRLPERVTQVAVRPGMLAIECGAFGSQQAAEVMRARLARFGASLATDYNAPRERAFLVRLGPHPSLAAAEASLRAVLPAGCLDGRIMMVQDAAAPALPPAPAAGPIRAVARPPADRPIDRRVRRPRPRR